MAFTAEQAVQDHRVLMGYVVRMLCAGLVHGDLSEFNVLVGEQGPVIIDLPQAVNAAANNHARSMLLRDVNNLTNYYGQFAADLVGSRFAEEIWALYEAGELHPDSTLSGKFEDDSRSADVNAIMTEIQAAIEEEEARLDRINEAELS